MSSSQKQIEEFAKYILNHNAKDDVLDRISIKLMYKFKEGTTEERVIISNIMDSVDLFMTELNIIVTESININEGEDECI